MGATMGDRSSESEHEAGKVKVKREVSCVCADAALLSSTLWNKQFQFHLEV